MEGKKMKCQTTLTTCQQYLQGFLYVLHFTQSATIITARKKYFSVLISLSLLTFNLILKMTNGWKSSEGKGL